MATDIETQHAYLSHDETTETEKPVTEEDWTNLRRVPGKLPMVALLILVVEVYQALLDLTEHLADEDSSVSDLPTLGSVGQFKTTSSQQSRISNRNNMANSSQQSICARVRPTWSTWKRPGCCYSSW
jgi:hypothetical protein